MSIMLIRDAFCDKNESSPIAAAQSAMPAADILNGESLSEILPTIGESKVIINVFVISIIPAHCEDIPFTTCRYIDMR